MSQMTSTTKKTNRKSKLEYPGQKEISKSRFAGNMSQITMHVTSQKITHSPTNALAKYTNFSPQLDGACFHSAKAGRGQTILSEILLLRLLRLTCFYHVNILRALFLSKYFSFSPHFRRIHATRCRLV